MEYFSLNFDHGCGSRIHFMKQILNLGDAEKDLSQFHRCQQYTKMKATIQLSAISSLHFMSLQLIISLGFYKTRSVSFSPLATNLCFHLLH